MVIISHRGNLNGQNLELENRPEFLDLIIEKYKTKLFVEIDLWHKQGKFYLGHDYAQYKVTYNWIYNHSSQLFIHCKNLAALDKLNQKNDNNLNYFWHQNDDFTLTSHGQIWTYPDKPVCKNSILVDLDGKTKKNIDIFGICTDFPLKYLNAKF